MNAVRKAAMIACLKELLRKWRVRGFICRGLRLWGIVCFYGRYWKASKVSLVRGEGECLDSGVTGSKSVDVAVDGREICSDATCEEETRASTELKVQSSSLKGLFRARDVCNRPR